MDVHSVKQTLQFGPPEKKIEVLGELNKVGEPSWLAEIQSQVEGVAFAGGKSQLRLYAVRALIVLGDTRDSVVDALIDFFGEDLFKDRDDQVIRFPWVPADLPAPEEGLGILRFRLHANISYTVIETLSRAKGSGKAAAFLSSVFGQLTGDSRVLCIYAMGALGHPSNRAALEYSRDNLANTSEGRAAEISLQLFGAAPVFGLMRVHAEKYGRLTDKKSGCFVITVISGSENSSEVFAFRLFRDNVLSEFAVGRQFVRIYYSVGPVLARAIGARPLLRKFLLAVLVRPLMWLLNLCGIPGRALRSNRSFLRKSLLR